MKKVSSIPVKQQKTSIKIGLDFGNKNTKVFINNQQYKFRTAVLVGQDNTITIGDKPPKQYLLYLFNLVDLVTSLKDERNQQSLQKVKKYYSYEFSHADDQIILSLKVLEEFQFKGKHRVNFYSILYQFLYHILQTSIKKEFPKYAEEQLTFNVAINFYGFETNIYKFILENVIKSMPFRIKPYFRKSTASLASYYYIKECQHLKMSKKLAILQFGDRGFAFSIYKMNPHSQKIIQCLQNFQHAFGGLEITRVIIDLIVQNVKIQNGIDVMNHPQIASKLPQIAQQAKIGLSQSDTVFVRVTGYPLQSVCGFYLVKSKIQKKIYTQIKFMLTEIKNILKKYLNQKIDFIMSGKSCLVPLFKDQFANIYHKSIITAQQSWMSQGLFLTLSDQLTILQILSESIKIVGDQGFEKVIGKKNFDLPIRFMTQMAFPSSQLTFTIKIIEYNTVIGVFLIEAQKLKFDQKFDCIIEIEQNKTIKMYSSRKFGTITMKGNVKILQLGQQVSKVKIIECL